MTIPDPLAFIPVTSGEWLLYFGVLIAGGMIYFLGNMIVGVQRSGGKRLILFLFGAVLIFCSVSLLEGVFEADRPSELLKVILTGAIGALVGAAGLAGIGFSFLGSHQALDKVFAALIRGI